MRLEGKREDEVLNLDRVGGGETEKEEREKMGGDDERVEDREYIKSTEQKQVNVGKESERVEQLTDSSFATLCKYS